MGLLTNNEPQIADGDIAVKKLVSTRETTRAYPYAGWIFWNFKYKRNKKYKTKIKLTSDDSPMDKIAGDYYQPRNGEYVSHVSYGPGFHSMTEERAMDYILEEPLSQNELFVGAIIPSGATYITDNTGLYISDSIIIL